jgi:hypothetical protein
MSVLARLPKVIIVVVRRLGEMAARRRVRRCRKRVRRAAVRRRDARVRIGLGQHRRRRRTHVGHQPCSCWREHRLRRVQRRGAHRCGVRPQREVFRVAVVERHRPVRTSAASAGRRCEHAARLAGLAAVVYSRVTHQDRTAVNEAGREHREDDRDRKHDVLDDLGCLR